MPDDRAPDLIEPFVGWRCWGVEQQEDGIRLVSHGETFWPTTGPLLARCDFGRDHEPPAEGCTCGIYALTDEIPYYQYDEGYVVFGQVYLYGTVVRGTSGFRAEKAYPKALWLAHKDWRFARPLRDAYRVPIRLADPHTFIIPRRSS